MIPANIAWRVADTLLTHGSPKRRYLGVAGQSVQLPTGQRASADQSTGVLVLQVMDDSPAARAGILVGDVLTALDGQSLDKTDTLLNALSAATANNVSLKLLRGGQPLEVSVETTEKR